MSWRTYTKNTLAVVGLLGFLGYAYTANLDRRHRKECPQYNQLDAAHYELLRVQQARVYELSDEALAQAGTRRAELKQRISQLESTCAGTQPVSEPFRGASAALFGMGSLASILLFKEKPKK